MSSRIQSENLSTRAQVLSIFFVLLISHNQPNDLLTAGWNQNAGGNHVNTRCAHVHAPPRAPTCSHLRPGPTCRRPARGQGGLFKHWVSRPLGSHSQSSRLFSRVSPASLHSGDLGGDSSLLQRRRGDPCCRRRPDAHGGEFTPPPWRCLLRHGW
jgi:hypothetical protein